MPIWSKIRTLFGSSSTSTNMHERLIPAPDHETMEQVLADLERVSEILREDGEAHFSQGIGIAIDHLKVAMAATDETQVAFSRAADSYRSMWGGMGSISEFYIVNGTTEEREQAQSEYDQLIHRLNQSL